MFRLLRDLTYFLLLLALTSCAAKQDSTYEPIPETIEAQPSQRNLLCAKEIEKGSYMLFVEELDFAQPYWLYVRGNVNHAIDCQEIFIRPDRAISLVCMPENRLVLAFEPSLLGESFDVFLLSKDKALLGHAHLIPFPVIHAQVKDYSITAEILNQTAECLFFTASGFEPEEEVFMGSGLNEEDGHLTKHTASKEGTLCFIENPAYRGQQGGKRQLLMIGKKGKIQTEYLWGKKLLDYSHAFFQSRIKTDST
ncbi:hypothetical protein [Parachlamydia sp. AcF125]|uniref:hypothetical protein n=1 Tax=Parachlamydia sp. AcF125 TaxID=2795736 RepID=UPI001BD8A7DA|nr:hypothetical protein [Parachlamydia sp. AcF125]MBS4169110.1 hypothetical protein [Parachlamydia sp. AcF125]